MRHPLFKTLKPYAILLLILIVAYLPVSTFYFGMKNDAFSDNFPNKFFLSEALSTHHLPLWNPYMNFGLPVYADMGFAFYNPITWVFAFIGYNAYTLTLEVLVYIYLGGIFMYRLGRYLSFGVGISITVAAMYMCCGFYSACFEYINFLTAAAFIPLVIKALLQLLEAPGFKHSFVLAIAVYFVFAGGHPAIPIMLIYFIAILLLLSFIFNRPLRTNVKQVSIYLFISVLLFLLFYLPAIYSYATILPGYARNTAEQQGLYTNSGFTVKSYLSFIFPFATGATEDIFDTVVSMRNGFFSITGILCVLCSVKSRLPLVKILLFCGCLMLVFSCGGAIKASLYNKLPLLGYIRNNGEYVVFAIACFCCVAGFGLRNIANGDVDFKRYYRFALHALLAACACLFVLLIFYSHTAIANALKGFTSSGALTQKIKFFLGSPFAVFLLVSVLITAAICACSIYAVKKNRFPLLLAIILFDVCLNSMLYLPITGVGQKTIKDIQAIYNTSPKGIIIPPLIPVNQIDTLNDELTGIIGDITYYNKKIGTTRLNDYPSYFTTTNSFFHDTEFKTAVLKHPWLFVKQGDSLLPGPAIHVESFDPHRTVLEVSAEHGDTLIFLQNNYKFWHAVVNNKPVPIQTAYATFMAVKLDAGRNEVMFYYNDRWLFGCCIISLLALLTAIVIVYRSKPLINKLRTA